MERWQAKLVSLAVTFVVIFGCMVLPIRVSAMVSRHRRSDLILSLLRCFAGGVFLATVLLHMIPEANHMLEHGLYEHHHVHYPVAEVIVLGGFFFICVSECTVLAAHARKRKPQGQENAAYAAETKSGELGVAEFDPAAASELPTEAEEASKTKSIILVLALAFECVFDGLGIGMQMSTEGTWKMFVGVLAHEFIVAFCLGIELIKHHSPLKVIFAALGYAIIPAFGIAMGMVVTETSIKVDHDTLDLISGIFIAVAAGIFLSCTFLGMLGEELIDGANFKKLLATIVGCVIMAGLAAIPHEHSHGDHHDIIATTTDSMVTEVM